MDDDKQTFIVHSPASPLLTLTSTKRRPKSP